MLRKIPCITFRNKLKEIHAILKVAPEQINVGFGVVVSGAALHTLKIRGFYEYEARRMSVCPACVWLGFCGTAGLNRAQEAHEAQLRHWLSLLHKCTSQSLTVHTERRANKREEETRMT